MNANITRLLLALAIAVVVAAVQPRSLCAQTPSKGSHGFTWTPDEQGVALNQGDELVLRYEFNSGGKPIVYPIAGPAGAGMTRDYPMKPAQAGGTKDHIHHRSLWLTHGEVNGVDFWLEDEKKAGRIVHEEVVESGVSEDGATLVTTANWVTPDGQTLLHEKRTMIVSGPAESRGIEFQFELAATDKDVHFGDTKEGSFAIRVPDSMAVDQKQGGTILNEHGEKDGETWGKRARWVAYTGPVDGKTVGVAILEHPSSFGHPCRWHVRTYGLFAANPFGEHHFVGGKPTEGHTLAKGETLRLRYKLVMYAGAADAERIESQWKSFAAIAAGGE